MAGPSPHPATTPARKAHPGFRLVLLALAALLLAPPGQAWVLMQEGPVHVDVDVNPPDTSPDPEGEGGVASVLLCSDRDPIWKVDADHDADGATVWVPAGADENDGSRKTSTGCGPDGKPEDHDGEDIVEVTVWYDPSNSPIGH